MSDKIIQAHVETETNIEYAIYPTHKERKESATFRKSKEKLKKDGHYKCWICNCTEKLEVHHTFAYAFSESFDFKEVKDTLMMLDFYGYSKAMKDIPFVCIDDIRNMIVLCNKHHKSELCGIHELSMPLFLTMKCTRDGVITVPQDKEDLEKIKNDKK